jgi:hypothetical protein
VASTFLGSSKAVFLSLLISDEKRTVNGEALSDDPQAKPRRIAAA